MRSAIHRRKILILSPIFPYPLKSGGQVRLLNILRYLSESCDLSLLCLIGNSQREYLPKIRPYCRTIEAVPARLFENRFDKFMSLVRPSQLLRTVRRSLDWITGMPFQVCRFYHPEMVGRLKRMLSQESYDGIYAICSQMAPYLTLAKATDENAKAILEDTELTFVTKYREFVLKKGLLRILASQEHQRAKDYAAKVWPRFDRIIVMSDLDKEKLLSLNRGMSILVVPNGVDTEYFRAAAPPRPDRKILGFLGGALHYPNVDALAYFCHDILPLVHRDMPDTSLLVIGDFFDRQACPSNTPVRYTGYVEDVRPHLADCTLFVAPIRIGGGTRLKILEAMSLGIPVVSTPIGCEGLDVEHGRDILIADTAEKFASSIKAVLSDETFRRSLSGNGRRLVEQKYAWRLVLKRLARFFQDEPTPGS